MTTAFVFPGQGAQAVGMSRALAAQFPSVTRLWDEADEALGYPLRALVFHGPEDSLKQTIHAQPAILVASLAALDAWRQGDGAAVEPAFVAGHSLGEYTALAAAGALSVTDAVRLVQQRAQAMQAAGDAAPGTMAAIIGLDRAAVQAIAAECDVELANVNCPGQLVVSGTRHGVAAAMERARAAGARPVVELAVSAAFHSRLMAPAAATMAPFLASASIEQARVPLVANVDARPIVTPDAIRAELAAQITAPVQWQQGVEVMFAAGVDRFIEFGPGKVLTGMIKRTLSGVTLENVSV